ncbi:MAG: hypothetical protein SFX19_02805 [Alphaproteobacteria bacterium]|nr:hypothetical protein [Alphaproteobacteria bacterium]
MMKKKILLVGESEYIEDLERQLCDGHDCHSVSTMVEAVEFLNKNKGEGYQLMVQDNLPIYHASPTPPEFPPEFNVHRLDRGAVLIRYVREQGLIASDAPTFLATVFNEKEKYAEPPEGVTKVIRLGPEVDIADQMLANLRGGNEKPTGQREPGK